MSGSDEIRDRLPLAPQDLQLLLAMLPGPLHGYGMMKAVEAQSNGTLRVELGSLYRMIQRLERDGLIAAADGAAPEPAPGRGRRFFEVTPFGRAVVSAELDRLRHVLDLGSAGLRPGEARS